MSSLNDTSPNKSAWGYKGLIVAGIIASVFIGFFYLAVTSEPDYMPSQQKKRQQEVQAQQQATQAQATEQPATPAEEPAPQAENKAKDAPLLPSQKP